MACRVLFPSLRFAGVCAALLTATISSCLTTAYAARSGAVDSAADRGPQNAASPARVRLISQEQYFNSLAYIFGADVTTAAHFAPFRRTEGLLEIGAASAKELGEILV